MAAAQHLYSKPSPADAAAARSVADEPPNWTCLRKSGQEEDAGRAVVAGDTYWADRWAVECDVY